MLRDELLNKPILLIMSLSKAPKMIKCNKWTNKRWVSQMLVSYLVNVTMKCLSTLNRTNSNRMMKPNKMLVRSNHKDSQIIRKLRMINPPDKKLKKE